MKDTKQKRKGVASIFLAYVMFAVMLVFFFAVGIPFLMASYVQFYSAGQSILTQSDIQNRINSISDPTIKANIQGSFTSAQNSIPTNINILGIFFQYSWIIIVVIIVMMLFMKTRVLVETQGIT
jgi:predicted PurR-regulated permease PerM